MSEQRQQDTPHERTLTIKEAERIAQEIADKIAARFEISSPAARKHLFSECLAVLMKNFTIVP